MKISVTDGVVDTKDGMLATEDCGCCRRYCKFTNCCNPLDFVYVDKEWLNTYFRCGDGRDRIVLKVNEIGSERGVCYSGNRNCTDSLSETEAQNQGVPIWGPTNSPSLSCVADNICGSVNCYDCEPNCCTIFFWGNRCGDYGAMGRPDDICCNWNQFFTRTTTTSTRYGSLETGHCLFCRNPFPQVHTFTRNSNADFYEVTETYTCVERAVPAPPETPDFCATGTALSTGYFRVYFRSFRIDCPPYNPSPTEPECCTTTSILVEDREEFTSTDGCWGGMWHQPPLTEHLVFDGNCEDEYEWQENDETTTCSTGWKVSASEFIRGEVSAPNCTQQSNRLFRVFTRDTRHTNSNPNDACAYGCWGTFYRQWLSSSRNSYITDKSNDGRRCNPNLCDELRIIGRSPEEVPPRVDIALKEADALIASEKPDIIRTNQVLGALDIL